MLSLLTVNLTVSTDKTLESDEFIIRIISGFFARSKTDHLGILPTINDLLNTVFVHALHCALSYAEFDEFYALRLLIASDRANISFLTYMPL